MQESKPVPLNAAASVHRVVPFAHVVEVDRSLAFYALLGFEVENVLRDGDGSAFWAMVKSGTGEMMFARASGVVEASEQAVLFYMYSGDVAGLRARLLERGVVNGGGFHGNRVPTQASGVVFEVSRPSHMPAGELRVHDPDGYVILLGQLG
jgi:catechol 2,3-dioxygenase-like lactoylglutathione lyase family enzyme